MALTDRETGNTLDVQFNAQGLVPAIVQDIDSGQVLMMGWMNAEAVAATISTKKATFFSRSRNKIWVKGESSGHMQEVVELRVGLRSRHAAVAVQVAWPVLPCGIQHLFLSGL